MVFNPLKLFCKFGSAEGRADMGIGNQGNPQGANRLLSGDGVIHLPDVERHRPSGAEVGGGHQQRQHPGKAQGRAGQSNGAHAAGPEISNDQKGAEEDHCRAEVIHQREAAADGRRIADKENQIPLCHQSLQGRRARKHEADLDQLRRLERDASKLHPVLRAEFFNAKKQVRRQQQNTAGRR